MNSTVVMRAVLLVAVGLNVACGNDTPSFSLMADSEEFQQVQGTRSTKMDILWVVDNSGSMLTSQTNLANNFSAFISGFSSRNYDYQIGVGTTDAYKEEYTGNSNYSKIRDGVSGNHTGEFVLNPLTTNLADTFLTNVIQGTSGSGDERAFQSIEALVNNPFNQSLFREDAFLAVIIVSDEDDFSRNSAAWKEDYNDPLGFSVQRYVDLLDNFKNPGSTVRRFNVSAMAVWDQPCKDSLVWSKIAVRYGELVDATDGIKGSLCGDFASELEGIADNILELATQFFLSRVPIPETIEVIVNGSVVPQEGWTFDPQANSIVFHGTHIPPEGASIDIQYDPAQFD